MKHVAALLLCQKLHEVSGWDDLDHSHCRTNPDGSLEVVRETDAWDCTVPRYDADYVLLRLSSAYKGSIELLWTARSWYGVASQKSFVKGDTPADAVTALAIELFSTGELVRKSNQPIK